MKIFQTLLLSFLVRSDEDAVPIRRLPSTTSTTAAPMVTYIHPDEPDFFDIDLNFFLTEGFEQYSQRPVVFNPSLNGRMRGMIGRNGGNPQEKIHPNTKNIAGMLRVRLLAMGIRKDVAEFKDLLGYGCWCNFLIKHDLRPKNMIPLDEIDEVCRMWSKCHECSSIDSYYQCSDQGHDEYKVRGIVSTGMFMCNSNREPCSLKACKCDTELVYRLSDILSRRPKSFDMRKTYKSGFNPYSQCAKVRLTANKKADQCCGEGNSRYPFYSYSGQKACCKSKTYDTTMYNCCPDGRLVTLGRRCIYNKY